jgi:putative membrane protein
VDVGIGFPFMLAFWGGVIALVVWAIRQFRPSDTAGSALRILQEPFARGEIDRQEYEQRESLLQH